MPIASSMSGKSYLASTKATIELTRRMSSIAPIVGLDQAICYPEHHFRFGVAITVRLQVHPTEESRA